MLAINIFMDVEEERPLTSGITSVDALQAIAPGKFGVIDAAINPIGCAHPPESKNFNERV